MLRVRTRLIPAEAQIFSMPFPLSCKGSLQELHQESHEESSILSPRGTGTENAQIFSYDRQAAVLTRHPFRGFAQGILWIGMDRHSRHADFPHTFPQEPLDRSNHKEGYHARNYPSRFPEHLFAPYQNLSRLGSISGKYKC